MRKKCSVCLWILVLLLSCLSGKSAYAATSTTIAKHIGNSNPLIDHHLGADPVALTYNGRVYIYMSSDDYEYNSNGTIKDNSFANLNRVFVISSADMVNWTDHGAIPVAGANGANGGRGIAKWQVRHGHRQSQLKKLMARINSSFISQTAAEVSGSHRRQPDWSMDRPNRKTARNAKYARNVWCCMAF